MNHPIVLIEIIRYPFLLSLSIKDFHLANRNLIIKPNEKPIAPVFFMVTEFSVSPDLIFSQSFFQDPSYGYGFHQESSRTTAGVPRLEVFRHCTFVLYMFSLALTKNFQLRKKEANKESRNQKKEKK